MHVIRERHDKVGILTIDHPEKRNALSRALIDEILAGLAAFEADGVRALIIRAKPGCKVWCAGHDLAELSHAGRDPLGWDDPLRVLVRAVEGFPAPVIAMMEGSVWGGGCELVMACDLLIATPDVTLAITPAKIGVPYNVSGMQTFLNAMPLPVVKEMLFTAQPMHAERALRVGMINHIVPVGEIEAFVLSLAETMAGNAPLSIQVMKEELRLLASADSITPLMFEEVQGLRRKAYESEDYEEGRRALNERRKPEFKGE